MPFEYAWQSVRVDCSEIEMESFLDAQKPYLKMKSQQEPCSVCMPPLEEHNMHYDPYMCNATSRAGVSASSAIPCGWYAKTVMCSVTKRRAVYQHGSHLSSASCPLQVKLNLAMKRFVREKTDARETPSRILNMMIDKFSLGAAIDYLPRVQRYAHY